MSRKYFIDAGIALSILTRDSLEYYLALQSEHHRETWTNVLMLLLTKLLKLDEEQFKYYSIEIYPLISEIVVFDLKPELRYILREFLLRIGRSFLLKTVI
ncbi:unnamed protein product [Rotaria magnacalcarata]|uniref:Sec7/BIG1-like C-terminal domain-containing protein n=1 Tax=Rotaria magnacalcarata TaxID=392030 RepID=A0A8S3JJT7_9BILA|nr:unnamed protein product [Rotaria magnacalcarata]